MNIMLKMDWSEGDLVWFDPGLGHPIPGEIQEVHRAAQVIIVQALIKGKPQTFTLAPGEGSIRARQDLGNFEVEDMTQLEDLHEASLLWNLRLRYDKGLIYTFAGSILVAVNPYKMFPDAYGLEVAKHYAGKPLGSLPPHLFTIGAAAHAALPLPQVVVISGESGSGKTESTKLVMQYLAAVVPGGGSASTVITEQILEAAPLLEAFGNARTTRNDNSSRFGKYLEVYFKSGAIVGAKFTQYLLEKSRIVTQALGERNYHVFYEMLCGLSETERNKFGLLEADKYFYLNQGGYESTPGRVDWQSLQSAMQVLGVLENEREGIVRVLASVLHLGNVYFNRRQLRHGQEGVDVGSDAEIRWAAHLLHISSEGLYISLTTRITEARCERVHTPLSIDQALDSRDAFAKALYSGLFNWLVSRINSIVHKGGTYDAHRISILDIFGFEDLSENSFEQLCINYANENLQLYFNKHVFKLEQAEYVRERLEWTPLSWEDNLPVIHLLAKKPVGIFHLLDDESNFPRASDMSFLEKCHYNHALNELYSRPRIGAQEFGITHYAGQVWYCVEGFLDKNRDALRPDVLELLESSKLQLVSDITKQLMAQRDVGKTLPRGSNGRFVTMKPRTPTVAARFSDSLQQLLQSMGRCNPWFVRCVKPNNEKQALKMDMPCVLQQLRYLGMLDTIQIRQKGYPVRLRFQHFVERYRHLLKGALPRGTPYRELCRNVLESLPKTGVEGSDFQLGATRVFLREALHRMLEAGRSERLKHAAVVIQKNVRGMLVREKLRRQKKAVTIIQTEWRRYKHFKYFNALKTATIKAQSIWRGKSQRKCYHELKIGMKRREDVLKAQKERQAQKLAKQNAERAQVAYLDIPAELAFIFSKIEGWTPIHGDRHIVKIIGTVPGPPVANDLPQDLDQFVFGKFSSVYCNGIKLSPRRDPIITPFLSRAASRDQDYQDSLAVFKLILRWTSDSSLEAVKEKALADYIVYKGLSSRGLRDEILVQLCNQIYTVEQSEAKKSWQLMGQCLSCFQPGPAFSKYLMKFIVDNAPITMNEFLLKKLLRNTGFQQSSPCRIFPPSWLEWRAISRLSDMAITLTLPDDITQTVAIDSWTTCEEAASLVISSLGISNQGWTVVLDDGGLISDSCGLDFILDLISEKEIFPAFPMRRNDVLKSGRKSSKATTTTTGIELNSPKRPQVPPPEPPQSKPTIKEEPIPEPTIDNKITYQRHYESAARKISHDLLSRDSALNERYFETERSRSRSLDDLLSGDTTNIVITPQSEPLSNLGLSKSVLNERYHSAERLAPKNKEAVQRYQKSQYAGKKLAGSHSSKYTDKSEYATRSSAMSDTSEAPSLASHVRRVRVPSQASDVDQFLDDLFSPVLDGSLDELSDARSLAASIKGGEECDFMQGPILNDCVKNLGSPKLLSVMIKGGGNKTDNDINVKPSTEISLDEYITDLFQPIFVNDSVKNLTEKLDLVETIKGGGTTHQQGPTNNGFVTSQTVMNSINPLAPATTSPLLMMGSVPTESLMQMINVPPGTDPVALQQQVHRAFLQSAMAQNLQIQQQLLAQNQALQTLLSQQDVAATSSTGTQNATNAMNIHSSPSSKKQNSKSRVSYFSESDRIRKISSENVAPLIPPPPPPPMPPPIEFKDPSEARPFIDPYGRAKTVRIGKWRWPPPQDVQQSDGDEDFLHFKMRQSQRKYTPQSQSLSSVGSLNGSTIEWEEFEIEQTKMLGITKQEQQNKIPISQESFQQSQQQIPQSQQRQPVLHNKYVKRSFEIGAERPPPGGVGKLKLSSEMRQRLEQVTAGHSIRSSVSTRSEQRTPSKLEDARKMMLQQQLGGNTSVNERDSPDLPSVRSQVQKMEESARPAPPPWPDAGTSNNLGLIPPPPVKPSNFLSPAPPPVPFSPPDHNLESDREIYNTQPAHQDLPAFMQRQEHDTFGVRHNFNGLHISKETYDTWGCTEATKLDMVYEKNSKKEIINERDRSRSRSRSRDRENFSESVWDRTEVEGPLSNVNDREREKEREKRERLYELKQVERERESNKVYQPTPPKVTVANAEREVIAKKSNISQITDRATFKTHMAQKYAKERKKKTSTSALISRSPENSDEISNGDNWSVPTIPAPVPVPPSLKTPANACLTYNRVNWKLRIRKEYFHPNESIGPPAALNLLFVQIASDIFDLTSCSRITPQEKRSALNLLSGYGITVENMRTQIRAVVKRHLAEMARSWPLYFARLFIVNGAPQFPDVSILAISHNGVFLARRNADHLIVVRSIGLSELQGAITLPRPAALQLNMRTGNRLTLHAVRAQAIQSMIQLFCQEFRQIQAKSSIISSGARAAAQTLNVPLERLETFGENNHESSTCAYEGHSNYRIIHNEHSTNNHAHSSSTNNYHHQLNQHNESGHNGMTYSHGIFNIDQINVQQTVKQSNCLHPRRNSITNHQDSNINLVIQPDDDSLPGTPPSITKHSFLQFAVQHFKNDILIDEHKINSGVGGRDEQRISSLTFYADLVKWQGTDLKASLLRLPPDLAVLASECFDCILRYCGDISPDPEQTEVKCVYTILMHCHKYLPLRDEVYCQLMKQTTANRSPCPDSAQRAWRLLSILAAYFGCSDALRPYLIEHLTSAASDRRKACHGTAAVCLTNLRKTARCGGRKNVPSVEEVTAVSAGRSARRQIYRLPGGAERVVNTRCSTVVADVIAELCSLLGIDSEAEQQEFSLYCIVQGDAFTMPLAADEYILDVTTELLKSDQPFYLIFCRSVWHFPLKRDPSPTPLYIEVLFNQVAPDYLEGLLLELSCNGAPNTDIVHDMVRVAALLHRAADLNHVPTMKEIKFLLPKPALGIREIRPAQWVALVQSAWPSIAGLSPGQVKATFLGVLSSWPLFGSSFFAVKRIWAEEGPHVEDLNPMWRDLILALNRRGVLFLDPNTHDTLQHLPFMDVISTRKVRSEDGALFLDMKVGNLMQQRVIRVQTEQAHEISRLIRQYITMAQVAQNERKEKERDREKN